MPLRVIADRLGTSATGDAVVTAVTHDSRAVVPGALFVAIPGRTTDGHDHIDQALAAGAVALVVEHSVDRAVPQIVVSDARAALAPIAAAVHHDPSHRMRVIGVTGTNGKTTVTHILESIAGRAGIRFGLIGTVGARIAGNPVPVARTTPEASDLQRLLAAMVEDGVTAAAIEVSSHALDLHRVDALSFSTVAFTNLSRDHLDFHIDMEHYYRAKASLFTSDRARRAVIAVDDGAGRRLAEETDLPKVTVSVGGDADVVAVVEDADLSGSTIELEAGSFRCRLRLPLAGRFNAMNAAVAAAVAEAEGIAADAIVAGLEGVGEIPGRFQRIDEGQPFGVVVDYAHTPDAIATVIASVRPLVGGRILVVVGAGGDRDREKRPLMGAAAAAADIAIITSDNPRSEDPGVIVAAVAEGAYAGTAAVIEEIDRRSAIALAIGAARSGDAVLILGKGHETGQEAAGTVEPFDDRFEARRILIALPPETRSQA